MRGINVHVDFDVADGKPGSLDLLLAELVRARLTIPEEHRAVASCKMPTSDDYTGPRVRYCRETTAEEEREAEADREAYEFDKECRDRMKQALLKALLKARFEQEEES